MSGSSTFASWSSGPRVPPEKPAGKPAVEKQVTVQGEAGSVPEGLAGRVAEHFVLGDRVKMTCRGSELTHLETVV